MAKKGLSKATYVDRGYGQVEPNHLSAQRTGQIYAQLPAAADIEMLENGQFAKYNYQAGVVNFEGASEWMLVFNEVKVYRDGEGDADFAMIRENYDAAIYSPVDGTKLAAYNAVDWTSVVAPADPYEVDSTDAPMGNLASVAAKMPTGTKMVPRLFKTNIGDIFTTNCVKETELGLGDTLTPGADGYLVSTEETTGMLWEVVKVYTLADNQKAVKLMRIA